MATSSDSQNRVWTQRGARVPSDMNSSSRTERGSVESCPVSTTAGERVEWLTVAALAIGPVPARQEFWLCRDPSCDVVYFGEGGTLVRRAELHADPGFKAGSTGLVCYCFQYRRCDLARGYVESGSTQVLKILRSKIAAGDCACQVRNPSGRCCLGEARQVVQEMAAAGR